MISQDKNVVTFLTECRQSTGSGHLSRCMSLQAAFIENGFKTSFIIDTDGDCKGLKNVPDYQALDWQTNILALRKWIHPDSVMVIDSYLARYEQMKEISSLSLYPVFISDVKMNYYPRGVVIIGNNFASDLDLHGKEDCHFLKGREYIMLRKDFWDLPEKKIKAELSSILITLGEFGPSEIALQVASAVHKSFPGIQINIITSEKYSKNYNQPAFISRLSAQEMAEQMLAHDLVICNGGQTLNECIRTGTPAIAVEMAENQSRNIDSWSKKGLCIKTSVKEDTENLVRKILEGIENLKPEKSRKKISKLSMQHIDGQGARNACDGILKYYNNKSK